MASTSRYGGPSWTADELADPDLPSPIVKRAEIGYVDRKEEPSAEDGGGYTQSSESSQTSDDKPKTPPRKRAQTTGNRSKAQQTEPEDSALSTDGDGQTTDEESDESFDEFDEFS